MNSRKYNDGQCAALEFSADSSAIAADRYTTTYGAVLGAPTWNEKKTSADGVLTFGGEGQYIIADSSYAALHEAEYQTAVLLRDNKKSEIFSFGGGKNISLIAENDDISLIADTQKITVKDAYRIGEWVTASVLISGGKAVLTVNNGRETKTAEGDISITPVQTMTEDALYHMGGFNGSMDYFRVYSKDVPEADYYYTETEDVEFIPDDTKDILWGDSNCDGDVSLADAVIIMQSIANPDKYGVDGSDEQHITEQGQKNGDVSENGNGVTNRDALSIQRYCLKLIDKLPE